MKALTLTQPWAQLVILGHKRFETRGWTTAYRGPLAIHAAKGWTADDRDYAREFGFDPETLVRGAVIGEVYLQGTYRTEDIVRHVGVAEERMGDFGPGRFAWELIAPIAYPVPQFVRGALGLWEWDAARHAEAAGR